MMAITPTTWNEPRNIGIPLYVKSRQAGCNPGITSAPEEAYNYHQTMACRSALPTSALNRQGIVANPNKVEYAPCGPYPFCVQRGKEDIILRDDPNGAATNFSYSSPHSR